MKSYLLRNARKRKGYTQVELSKIMNISLSKYIRIENGLISPRIEILEKFFEVLHLTKDEKIQILLED